MSFYPILQVEEHHMDYLSYHPYSLDYQGACTFLPWEGGMLWTTRTKTGFPCNGIQLASFRGVWQCLGRGKPFFCACYTWIYLIGYFYPPDL